MHSTSLYNSSNFNSSQLPDFLTDLPNDYSNTFKRFYTELHSSIPSPLSQFSNFSYYTDSECEYITPYSNLVNRPGSSMIYPVRKMTLYDLHSRNNGLFNQPFDYVCEGISNLDSISLSNIGLSTASDVLVADDAIIPLDEDWYSTYHKCRQRKSTKPSHLKFYFDMPCEMHYLVQEVNNREYVPRRSICFVITYPRDREVIAADFADRLVQTRLTQILLPEFEQHVYHPDSFSCRVGKGSLAAVCKLQDYIFTESKGFTEDIWLAKIDLKNFFMSIDTDRAIDILNKFILDEMVTCLDKTDIMWMARIVYQSRPQLGARMCSPWILHYSLDDGKKMLNKDTPIGLAIGNVTNQVMANFITTFYLRLLESMGYKFVHYTDDTCVIVHDLNKWKSDLKRIDEFLRDELHLRLHPKKYYIQHYSKGVEFLGFKLQYDRVLPSDRIVHNIDWMLTKSIRFIDTHPKKAYDYRIKLQQQINSFMGLMRWGDTYNLRCVLLDRLIDSQWGQIFESDSDCTKISLRKGMDIVSEYHIAFRQ